MKSFLKRLLKFKLPIYLFRTFEKFNMDSCSYFAATLTFYTLFALVPFLGLMFGIAQSFGFESALTEVFKTLLEGQEQIYENLLLFTQNLLSQTKEEVIAGVGLVVLLWSVFKVFRVLDHVFNRIWGVKFQKNPFYRLHQFSALLLLLPIALVILGGMMVWSIDIASSMLPAMNAGGLDNYLPSQTKLISIILFTLLMGFSYWGLPSIQLPLLPALLSGFVGSLLFHGLQYIYINFQKEINEYGMVYGSFASVPLFMMWIYISWTIYLLGAELTYILESRITRKWQLKLKALPLKVQRVLLLEIMSAIKERFEQGDEAFSTKQLSEHLSIPVAVIRNMLDKLIAANLIAQTQSTTQKSTCYVPKVAVKLLNEDYIVQQLEISSVFGKTPKKYGAAIESLINKSK